LVGSREAPVTLAASRGWDLVDFPRPGAAWGLAKSVEQIPRA
jgi:hypothetical protein